MFAGDDDDNPFANAISPFGSTSTYQPPANPFASASPEETTFPSSQLAVPSLQSTPYAASTPGEEYGFAAAVAQDHPYGAFLETPILSPQEERPSPYVAAIEQAREVDGFGSPPAATSSFTPNPYQQDTLSASSSAFGGAAAFDPSPSSSHPSTFGVPAYSSPPVVDLHAVEDELAGPGKKDSGFSPLMGLLGETEEEKMKSAFKKSSGGGRTPVKKKPPPPKKAEVKKEAESAPPPVETVEEKKVDAVEKPQEENLVAGSSQKEEPELTAAPSSSRPSTPPPPPSTAPAVKKEPSETPPAAPAPDSPVAEPPTPSSPPSSSPTQTPLPTSAPSSPPRQPSPSPPSPPPSHTPTPSFFPESSSSSSNTTMASTPHVGHVIVSPLETPTQEYEQSFASLALGGSAGGVGGWGGEEDIQPRTVVSSALPSWGGADATGGGWGEVVEPEQTPAAVQDEEDDEEDNKPLQARVDQARSSSPPPPSAVAGEKAANRMFEIHVGDPTKVGLAATAHIVYTVTTRTTSQSAFSRSDVSVLRRFSDFLWLFTILQTNNPGVIVPPVPDKHPFGRFAEDFVETRRHALEQCLQKMANHPVLQLDPDLRLFLESDTLSMEMKNRKAEVASEQKGYLASLTSTLAGPKYYERDEWFDQKKLVLDTLESQLKILVKSIELVSKQRLDLAVATSDFAEAIASLAASDLSKQLSHALERLADIGRRSRDVHEDNAKGDVRTFMSTADEYIRLIASVRLAFASRVKTYLTWQSLGNESRRVALALDKARKANKIPQERIGMEIQIAAEAERRHKEAQAEYESVSRLVKNEFVRFETERVEDFKNALEAFLEGMIKRQKILIAAFEDYHRDLLKLVQQNPNQTSGGRPPPPSPLPTAPAAAAPEEQEETFVNGGGGAIVPPADENAWA